MLLCCLTSESFLSLWLALSSALALMYTVLYTCKTLKWLKDFIHPAASRRSCRQHLLHWKLTFCVNWQTLWKATHNGSGSRFQMKGIKVRDAACLKVQVKRNAIHPPRRRAALFSKVFFWGFSPVITSSVFNCVADGLSHTWHLLCVYLDLFHQHDHWKFSSNLGFLHWIHLWLF